MGSKRLLRSFPRLDAAYKVFRESKHRLKPPVKSPLGFWFTGNRAMQSGEFEPEETAIVHELLQDADVLINVGANIGYYCCIALGLKKRVIAFEPLPRNLDFLMQNITSNGWDDAIEVFPMALSSQSGIAKFFGAGTGASLIQGWAGQPEDQLTLVPMSTIDIVLGERMQGARCVVLVDVEGAELKMLQGATKLLGNDPRPTWLVEISINEHQPAGVTINPDLVSTFDLFFQAGYRAFTATSQSREILLAEVERVAETGIDTLQTHNFVFRHPASGTSC